MYLSDRAVAKKKRGAKIELIVGIILMFIITLAIFGFAVGKESVSGNDSATCGILCLIFILMIYKGIKKLNLCQTAKIYNAVFKNDADGYISLSELASKTGTTKEKAMKNLNLLIKKDMLVNCYLDSGTTIVLGGKSVLNNGVPEETAAVTCPNCGATNTVKVGFTGVCEYCGSKLKYNQK